MSNVLGLMKSLRLRGRGMRNFHEALFFCMRDIKGYTRDEFNARWRPRGIDTKGTLRGYEQPMSDALFDEWKRTRDASWLYSHKEYLFDSVGVSTFQTTNTATGGVNLIRNAGLAPKRVFDWGAGPGFSSFIMAANLPHADVEYNELNADLINVFTWFKDHSNIKNVRHVAGPSGRYDIIQAYEIVEHIPSEKKQGVGDPMSEFGRLIDTYASHDAHLLQSTCWNAERNGFTTLGHFLKYDFGNDVVVDTSHANKHFLRAMGHLGWRVYSKGWNSRPYLFERGLAT